MRTVFIAAALSVLAIVPASAQSCVSNGAFVPCQGGGMAMGAGMAPMGAGMMQPGNQGMSSDPMMADRRMEQRSSSRRASRMNRQQMMDADQ
jgi:hypothetical protein